MRGLLRLQALVAAVHAVQSMSLTGPVIASSPVPFNKGPRPAGCATAEQKSARGPKRGKGTRKARRRAT